MRLLLRGGGRGRARRRRRDAAARRVPVGRVRAPAARGGGRERARRHGPHAAALRARTATTACGHARGADVHARDWRQTTPLHGACTNSGDGVRLLLHEGERERADWRQKTPLHDGAGGATASACAPAAGGGRARATSTATRRCTPRVGWRGRVRAAPARGADVNAPSLRQKTPRHYARLAGPRQVRAALLEAGADGGARATRATHRRTTRQPRDSDLVCVRLVLRAKPSGRRGVEVGVPLPRLDARTGSSSAPTRFAPRARRSSSSTRGAGRPSAARGRSRSWRLARLAGV